MDDETFTGPDSGCSISTGLGYLLLRLHAEPTISPAGPVEKVTIAYSATTDSVLAQVAQTRGYYREEGLEVTPHMHPYGKPALREVLEGKADFATVAETPVMFAILNGEKISDHRDYPDFQQK